MKEKPHLIDVLLNVPVTTKPILICELLLDSIEPLFGRVIHCGLINKRKKCLARFIPEGTGMRENNINFPIDLVQGLCHLRFDFFRRLLVSPSTISSFQPVLFVHTIGTAYGQMLDSFKVKHFAILSKK